MSLADCLKKTGISNEEVRILDDLVAKHQADGMEPEAAQRAAIESRLGELNQDKADVQAKVDEAVGPTRELFQKAATLGIEVGEITDAKEIEKILEEYAASQVRPGRLQADDNAYQTVAGKQAQVGWREATSIVRNGQPALVHRGARGNLTVEKFSQENLGKATGHPSSGLGVFLSSDYGQAAGYGPTVESVHIDMRNPKIYTTDTMPEFGSVEEAFAHREALQVEGFDGIVIDLRDVGAPVNYVVFDADQVIHPPKVGVEREFYQEAKEETEYCNVCDRLRRTEEGEQKWQAMMDSKQEISEGEFLNSVEIDESNILDEEETWEDYRSQAGEDLKFYESDNEFFFQVAGFEFIWNKKTKERVMYQPEQEEAIRASIQFTEDNESLIRLTRSSDLSSFLHESGHLFLEMERRFAEKFGQTEDQQTLLDWLGVKSFEDLEVEHHEKFAETFEAYLREGKAPSLKLREAFAAFARWLTVIYRTITEGRLGRAELTPEIHEYMDRMLATEAEIEQAMANPAYDQLFRSKEQAGMTDVEWAAYQKQAGKARNAASADLNQQVIDELRKRKSREWNEEKEPLIEEEIERLSKLPVYQVISDAKELPMDYDLVIDALSVEGKKAKIPGKLIGKAKKGGVDPAEYADIYGFKSASEMLKDIDSAKPLKAAAEEAAESRMVEKYGDMLNDGRIELEARDAVHNEEQAKLLVHEIKGLSKKAPTIDREYMKAEAIKLVSEMTFKEMKPSKYYRAEMKAAQQAATATTDTDKLSAKIKQLANHYLYTEVTKTKEAMAKQRKQVRGFETRKYNTNTVHPAYAQNIRMLAKSYNMRKGEAGRNIDVERIVSWMITQMNDPNNYVDLTILDPSIIKMIVARQDGLPVDYSLPGFDDLTAKELKGLVDQLRHMRFVGGRLSDAAKNELLAKRQQSAESITEYSKKEYGPRHEITKTERTKDSFLEFGYSHRRIGGIFETLDGFEEGGPMADEYEKITDASNNELDLTDLMAQKMNDAFKGVMKKVNRFKKETITKADGADFTLSHRARFVLGLNWGNESNRDALLDGLNTKFEDSYTSADIVKMLSTMSDQEINALNKIWAAKELLWPHMSKVEVKRKGVSPEKIQASPFEINGIKLTGGHYRLHYLKDPADTARTEITTDRAASKSIKVGTASSMNERVGSGGRQVDLELGHLFQDINEEIHYIAYAELSDHLNSMFKGVENDITKSIIKGYGMPYYDNLINTLSTLTQPEDPAKGLWKGLKYVRSNLTYGFLAGSVRNIIQQPIAVTNAISQLGMKTVLKGAFEFYRNPVGNWDKISKASSFMKNRTALVNREAREQLLKVDAIHPALGAMKNLAFMPQTFMDSLIAYPTWMGALSDYKKKHPNASEKKAIYYADEMVAKTIGSGLSKDVGAILNKGEAEKQITFMGTFFNLTWNLHVENLQLLKAGKINSIEYAQRLGWMAIAPALLSIWLLDDIPEDDDELIAHILKEVVYYNMSSMFLVRDLAGAMDGFNPSIPGLKFADGIVRVGSEMQGLMTGDEEFDANTVASIIRGVQPLVPFPMSGQIARTIEGMADPEQGVYGAFVEGKERN